MYDFIGSYYLLTLYPAFQTITVLGLISIGAMFFIRDFFEGLAYNTSRCALWGGVAVLAVIGMGISILNNSPFIPPFLSGATFHFLTGLISIVIAIINVRTVLAKARGKEETIMDTYHNWVLLPGYIYLMLTVIPLILVCGNGWSHVSLILLAVVYVKTLVHDIQTGRLNQPKFLWLRGLRLPIRH